jgi:hypothetical protein
MNIKMDTIIDMDVDDIVTLRKASRICNELMGAFACMTVSDEAYASCADNGEVFVTENEVYKILDVFGRIERIMEKAPYLNSDESCGHKAIAVKFYN